MISCAANASMANYIPWCGKKKARLAEVELTFIAILKDATDSKELKDFAEKVRLAHVRALKAKRAQLPPTEKAAVAVETLDREMQFWNLLTADQIVAGYRDGSLLKQRGGKARE